MLAAAAERDLLEAVDLSAEPETQLDQILRHALPAPTARGALLWLDATAEVLHPPGMHAPVQARNDGFHRLLVQVIERGQLTGTFKTADANSSAQLISALLSGLTTSVCVHRALDRQSALELAHRACAQELGSSSPAYARGP